MDAKRIIEILDLKPLPGEGGYFIETYRSRETVPAHALHPRYGSDKSHSTAIYYLITPEEYSRPHCIISDEVFHFYAGDPVEMLQLHPDGSHSLIIIGPDLEAGQRPQLVVPQGVWQASRLVTGGKWALLGTTVAPGFDFTDYEHADPDALVRDYPECEELIRRFS